MIFVHVTCLLLVEEAIADLLSSFFALLDFPASMYINGSGATLNTSELNLIISLYCMLHAGKVRTLHKDTVTYKLWILMVLIIKVINNGSYCFAIRIFT